MEKVHYKIHLLKNLLKGLIPLVFLLFAGKSLFAFNGGTYTINSGAAASATLTSANPMSSLEQTRWFSEQVQPHEPALRAYLSKRFPALPDHDDLVQVVLALQRGQVHRPLSRDPRDLVVRLGLWRQRPPRQEVLRPPHRLRDGPR